MRVINNIIYFQIKNIYLFFIVFSFSLLSALRVFGYDRDYNTYQQYYEKISFGGYSSRFEPGFEFIANLFKLLTGGDSFTFFLFFVAFISLRLKFSILSNTKNYLLLLMIYFMLIFPLHEMMQIRIALGAGVMFWAIYKSLNSKVSILMKSLLVCIGLSIHYSVIILAPFIIFSDFFSKKRSILWIASLTSLTVVLMNYGMELITYFVPFIEFYLYEISLVENIEINPFSSRNVIFVTILLLGIFNVKKIPKQNLPWLYISILGIGLWYGFMWLPVFAHRFLELTVFAYLIWVPSLPGLSKIISLNLLFILSAYFLIRLLFLNPYFS